MTMLSHGYRNGRRFVVLCLCQNRYSRPVARVEHTRKYVSYSSKTPSQRRTKITRYLWQKRNGVGMTPEVIPRFGRIRMAKKYYSMRFLWLPIDGPKSLGSGKENFYDNSAC